MPIVQKIEKNTILIAPRNHNGERGYIVLNPSKLNFDTSLWSNLLQKAIACRKEFFLPEGILIHKVWINEDLAAKIIFGWRDVWISEHTYDAAYKWDNDLYKASLSFMKNNPLELDIDFPVLEYFTGTEITEENYKKIAKESKSDD